MTGHHLAQLNVARMRAPIDSPVLADFVAMLEPINTLAESSPGFVWRHVADPDDPRAVSHHPDLMLVNFSIWESREALWNFAYRSAHLDLLRRRREWFTRIAEPYQVLWWTPAVRIPSVEDAFARLHRLREHGPAPAAFTFRDPYPPPADSDEPGQARR